MHGTQDVLVPVSNSRALCKQFGWQLCEYNACGHVPHEEYPDRFVQDVRDFLAKQRQTC